MLRSIRTVLGGKKYRMKFIYAFLAVFVVASFLMNFISFFGLLRGKIIFTEIVDFYSLAFLVVFSVLSALAVTMHLYRAENCGNRSGKEKVGILGAFLGVFTSACSICYPLILTLLGIPAAFAFLPFSGAEFQAASIALLLLSIFFISRSIECNKC
ncbi:MAG: hypothetical protein HYT73_04285 [Candidatus Aenigmarchaeota archaeon]|nr:hypothetical protein [Candidatus Aenigmarchaeota archaeon]